MYWRPVLISLLQSEGVQGPMLGLRSPGMATDHHPPGVRRITFWHALAKTLGCGDQVPANYRVPAISFRDRVIEKRGGSTLRKPPTLQTRVATALPLFGLAVAFL